MNPEAPKRTLMPEQENEELIDSDGAEEQIDDPEYGPEDAEGIARAAAGATQVIQEAVSGNRRLQTSYTNNGLRSVVEANVPDAHVRGDFADGELKEVTITLSDSSGEELPISIIQPESGHPRVMLGGQLVDPNKIPAINQMIEEIKTATAEKPEEPPVEEVEEDEETSEKIAA